jgi:hypothetical protein
MERAMARALSSTAGPDFRGFIRQSMEGTMIRQDARRHTEDASSSLEHFKHDGAKLQKAWTAENWIKINDTVDEFCRASLRVNRSVGGLHSRAFDDANDILGSFVDYAEDLLQEAAQKKKLPSKTILQNIRGVIKRCKLRIQDLTEKRNDIGVYEKKIREIVGSGKR